MGLFDNLFSKKNTAAVQPTIQQPEQTPKKKSITKSQRFILDDTESHIDDIMNLVEKNEDYKLKKKDLIEDNRVDEKIFKYELNTQATISPVSCGGVEQLQVFVHNTHIGNIKKGGMSRVRNLLKKANIQRIDAEVTGGEYKELTIWDDEYNLAETEKPFGITIEITYLEEITE